MMNPRITVEGIEGNEHPLVIEMSKTEPVLWLINGDERIEVRGPLAKRVAFAVANLATACATARLAHRR